MTNAATPTWYPRLHELLTSPTGAQLEVTDPDGTTIYLAPLARSSRIEDTIVWFRQIIGTGPEFDFNHCRRRSLPAAGQIDDANVCFTIDEGTATISPANPDGQAAIAAWDNYLSTRCDEQTRTELAALAEDSWA